MKTSAIAIGATVAALAFAALAHRQAVAAHADMGASIDTPGAPEEFDAPAAAGSVWDSLDVYGFASAAIENKQVQTAMQTTDTAGQNVAAWLSMIAASEGTDRAPDPYRVCYGYAHTIADLSGHPAATGEWKGERLSDAMCKGAGLSAGCVSTAAGRYQMIRRTWEACAHALRLTDFGSASQDAAAVYLTKQRGALDDVQAGRIAQAIDKCRREWASLPGAGYGQPERRLTALLDTFTTAGGNLA